MIPKPDKDTKRKESYRPVSLMKIDEKILNIILTNQIKKKYIKRIIHCDHVGFIPVIQRWYNIYKSINVIDHINKMNGKNPIIISIDEEKAFDKSQYLFMIKSLNIVDIKGTFLNIKKANYDKPTAHIIVNYGKLKSFKIRKKKRMSILAFLFNIVLGVLATAIRQGKEIKCFQIGKEEVKLSLLADNMIPCI